MFPVNIKNRKFIVSSILFVISLHLCAIYIAAFVFSILYMFNLPLYTYVAVLENSIDSFSFSLIPLIAMIEIVYSLNELNSAMKKIQEIAYLVEDTTYQRPRGYFRAQCFLFCTSLIFGIGENIVAKKDIKFSSMLTVYYNVIYLTTVILVHRYAGLMNITMSLNKYCNDQLSFKKLTTSSRGRYLETMCQSHNKLSDISLLMHKSQRIQILMIILSSFFAFVTEIFQMVAVVQTWSEKPKYYRFLESLSWTLKCFLSIWQITATCTNCRDEVGRLSRFIKTWWYFNSR